MRKQYFMYFRLLRIYLYETNQYDWNEMDKVNLIGCTETIGKMSDGENS